MTTIKALNNELKQFFTTHPLKPRYNMEFREQMPNLATASEVYPYVFFGFSSSNSLQNVKVFTFDVYCVDAIENDRSNIIDVISEMEMLINDVFNYLFENGYISENVVKTPLNNFDLDYVGGWVASFDIVVNQTCQYGKI